VRPLIPVRSATSWKQIVSGRRRGVVAAIVRFLLSLAEFPYGLAVRWRNGRYDRGRAEITRAAVPVISVGNLTVGGTGKTPMVAWLARWFLRRDIRVTLISRGYGAERGAVNDEARELEQRLPDVPHVQNPDRVAAAAVAVEELESQLILLDDAFQHRRIARDLDMVLIDALEPFGFEHLLPRGTLRESIAGLRRAHVVALSRADMIDQAQRDVIWQRVVQVSPEAVRLELAHRPQRLVSFAGAEMPLADLAGLRAAAFCGIGNPDGFRRTLQSCGCHLLALNELPDHFSYDRAAVESLALWADSIEGSEAVICTQKDLVKLQASTLGTRPLWALEIAIEILSGEDEFETLLERVANDVRRA
jgi:tetraacyldisaccharide 4'-kinase